MLEGYPRSHHPEQFGTRMHLELPEKAKGSETLIALPVMANTPAKGCVSQEERGAVTTGRIEKPLPAANFIPGLFAGGGGG